MCALCFEHPNAGCRTLCVMCKAYTSETYTVHNTHIIDRLCVYLVWLLRLTFTYWGRTFIELGTMGFSRVRLNLMLVGSSFFFFLLFIPFFFPIHICRIYFGYVIYVWSRTNNKNMSFFLRFTFYFILTYGMTVACRRIIFIISSLFRLYYIHPLDCCCLFGIFWCRIFLLMSFIIYIMQLGSMSFESTFSMCACVQCL